MAQRLRKRTLAALTAVLPLLFSGCGDHSDGTLEVGWRFADGRDCSAAGVESVEVVVGAHRELLCFPCLTGITSPVDVGPRPPGFVDLHLDARSAQGSLLYKAAGRSVLIEAGQRSVAVVELVYVGGDPTVAPAACETTIQGPR